MREFKFVKEDDNKWYVDLPEWEGDHAELEMVCGADTMLDIIAQGEDHAYMRVSEKDFDDSKYTLTFKDDLCEGGVYELKSDMFEFDVWLCHVTKFVYGYLPKKLYCC